jgi:sulfite exporter TauE/SafE
LLARFRQLPPVPRAALLGLSTTLVPCGWLYAFVATAAGTGDAASAMGAMFVFWVGTVPALVAAGFGLRGLLARFGRHARAASASLIVVSGVFVLALRLSPTAAESTTASAPSDVKSMPASCPLHRH